MLHLEVDGLVQHLRLGLLSEVKYILDKIDFTFERLVQEDDYIDAEVEGQDKTTCICYQVSNDVVRPEEVTPIAGEANGACDVRLLA